MFKFLRFTLFAFLAVSLFSCEEDEPGLPAFPEFENGVFIINEGNFGTPNGSISFYDFATQRVSSKIFQTVNNKIVLGDVVQSLNIFNEKGFIVINNSNRVEIVESKNFKSLATITKVNSPRYLTKITDSKAYLSNWGNGGNGFSSYISIMDLNTNTIVDSIGNSNFSGLEQMVVKDGKVYVSNYFGSTVSVINASTNVVEKQIATLDAPQEMKIINNEIWVLCEGAYNDFTTPTDDTKGGLVRINTVADTVDKTMEIGEIGQHLGTLETDGSSIFYTFNGKTFKMETAASTLPTVAFIGKSFYGLGIDPKTGNIFGGDAKDFVQTGVTEIYNSAGVKISTFESVGLLPNGFVFVD